MTTQRLFWGAIALVCFAVPSRAEEAKPCFEPVASGVMRDGTPAKQLTAEFVRLANWIDVNCLFHPSYWGRLNAQFQDHPNYRPEITVEQAQAREVPDPVREAELATAP